MLKIYVFKCRSNSLRRGFSNDKDGANLPNDRCSAGWEFAKEIDLTPHTNLIAVSAPEVIKGVDTMGYYITDAEINMTENTDPF